MSTWYEKAAGDIYEAVESLVPAETARKIVNTLLVMLTKMVESGDGGSSSVGFTSEGDKYDLVFSQREVSLAKRTYPAGYAVRVVWTEE